MKSSIIKSLLLGTALSCASVSFAMAEDYNWSGIFLGGTVGATDSKSDSTVDYGSVSTEDIDGNYTVGWENGFFTGGIYDDLNDLDIDGEITDGGPVGVIDTDLTNQDALDLFDDVGGQAQLEAWVDAFNSSEMNWSATAILGGQIASGSLVFGAELRGTFGDFDTSTSDEWLDTARGEDFATCTVTEDTCDITYTAVGTNSGGHINWADRSTGVDTDWDTNLGSISAGYEAEYAQINNFAFGASYDSVFSPVAKLGFAVGRVHLFAMGGPSWSKVKATTSASANEVARVDVFYNESDETGVDDFTGEEAVGVENGAASYDWSGSNTETLAGYSVGGGMEWAATDNLILRAEGLYTDLGSIDVTGVSDETAATYTVTQELNSVSGSVGMLVKF
jgi:opacity protein-like surface antigen